MSRFSRRRGWLLAAACASPLLPAAPPAWAAEEEVARFADGPATYRLLADTAAPRTPWRLVTPGGECRLPVADLSRTVSRGDVFPLTARFGPAACPGGLRPQVFRLVGATAQAGRWRAVLEAEGLRHGRLDADLPAAPLDRIIATLRR